VAPATLDVSEHVPKLSPCLIPCCLGSDRWSTWGNSCQDVNRGANDKIRGGATRTHWVLERGGICENRSVDVKAAVRVLARNAAVDGQAIEVDMNIVEQI